jgi:uncharacterized MAPEG superfamily protein
MVLIAAFLPVLTVGSAKAQRGYDNSNPRTFLANLRGWRARADFAHRNHFEAFPPFAAGVIIAQLKATPQPTIDELAVAFIVIRVVYTALYLADLATLRTIVFGLGAACVVGLFVI